MRIKHTGKVGIDMKRETRTAMSASRRAMSINDRRHRPSEAADNRAQMYNAVRFTFAQLFFGIFGFTPLPI